MRTLRLLSFLLLAGCGQSGDLYLPADRPEPATTPPAAETPAEDEDQKAQPPKDAPKEVR
jgi:predicted small lipoprotein YifL